MRLARGRKVLEMGEGRRRKKKRKEEEKGSEGKDRFSVFSSAFFFLGYSFKLCFLKRLSYGGDYQDTVDIVTWQGSVRLLIDLFLDLFL